MKIEPNKMITEHFSIEEFICPCCDKIKIIPAFFEQVAMIEELRQKLNFPIQINSGYRCPSHNKTVKGTSQSWHLLFATDIQPVFVNKGNTERYKIPPITDDDFNMYLDLLWRNAQNMAFGGIAKGSNFIHLDLRPTRVEWRYD